MNSVLDTCVVVGICAGCVFLLYSFCKVVSDVTYECFKADNEETETDNEDENESEEDEQDEEPKEECNKVDFFSDCTEFAKLYCTKTGAKPNADIDVTFITKMVNDELQELKDATDEAEQVDALLDAVYYIFDHLAKTGLDIRPIWKLIHKANMTKFEKGHKREDGKWMKPSDFVPPDDAIREEIFTQRSWTNSKPLEL